MAVNHASCAPGLPPNRTLSHFYTSQTRLGDFVASLFRSSTDLGLICADDSPTYLTLLDDTLVCTEPGYEQMIWEGREPSDGTMSEMLNRAIVHIFKTSKGGKPSNQLTNGFTGSSFAYSLVGDTHATWNEQRPGIYSKHLNTSNSCFAKRTWATLVDRIGPGPFHHLLTCTSLFLSLPNECLSQLTGTPMVDLKPLDSTDSRLGKRARDLRLPEEDEEALWREVSPPPTKKRRRRARKKRSGIVVKEEEEDPEMLDADVEMEISMGDAFAFEEPVKIKKKPCSTREPAQKRSPSDITFVRTRIFYARSLKKAGRSEPEKRVLVGLPPNHILASLQRPAQPDDACPSGSPPSLSSADSTLLLKYLFPLQFGLHNVFTSSLSPTASKSSHAFLDYTSRKDELERRREEKMPAKAGEGKRVKEGKVRALVEELWRRHRGCDYWKLRAICCPSKVVLGVTTPIVPAVAQQPLPETGADQGGDVPSSRAIADTTLPLEFVSQPPQNATQSSQADRSSTTLHLQSQVPFSSLDASHHSLVMSQGVTVTEVEERKKKQKFKNFTQSTGQVSRFATQVIKRVVPLGFFGSEANRKLILDQVGIFIGLRRFESLSLHAVLQGFCISDCAWLEPDHFKPGERVSALDAAKRREILHEFVYWLFDSFLIPLLKTTFYVTESAAFKKQVLYFRQDDWDVICKPLFDQLQTSAYEKLSKAEVARTSDGLRQLGHSYVRLLPKENGVRPLINLRRVPKTKAGEPVRDTKGAFVKSINSTLKDTFSILVQSKDSDPTLFGASILGADDIYPKLKQFKQRTTGPDGLSPPYFFAKVDVRSCFDTIDQTKLMEILEEMLEADEGFSVVRFNKAKLSGGHVRKKFLQRAYPKIDSPTFPELAEELSKRHHREILMDKAYETSHDKDDTLSLLREHITNNLIKMGPDFFRQSKGIPQGSIVSTHLCSSFYADMERRHLGFTSAEDCMLVRLVDDFLLVTTDKDKAVNFVRTMHHGHPDYGCYVSREKTLINFECRLEGEDNPIVTSSTDFPWCGRLIDTRHLHVKGDYSRDSTHIKNTLTVNTVRHPGLTVRAKVFRNIAQKSSICFNDTILNTPRVVYLNIYQNLVFCAMKTIWYVKELRDASGGAAGGELGNAFLLDTIREAGDFTYNTVKNGARSRDAREQGGQVDVEKQVVVWLTHHAFLSVFGTKPTLFRTLLSELRQPVEIDPAGRELGRQWKGLVEESWQGMRGVVF